MIFKDLFRRVNSSSLFHELSWTLASQSLGNLLRFLLVFVVIRSYSVEEFGLWATITSVGAVIITGDFGLTNVLRNIASEGLTKGQDGERQTRDYYLSAVSFLFFIAVVGIIIIWIIKDTGLFESLFKTDSESLKITGKRIILIVLGIFLISLPLGLSGGMFISYGEIKVSSIFSIISNILTFLIVVTLSLYHASIEIVSVLYFLCPTCISITATFYFVYKRQWSINFIGLGKTIDNLKKMLPLGVGFLGIGFTSHLLQNLLTILSGSLLGLTIAANINVAQKAYNLFIGIIQSLLNPIWARLSKSYFNNDHEKCKRLMKRSLGATITLSVLIIVVMTLFRNIIILLIAGDEYDANVLVFLLVGSCLFAKLIFDNASLLLIATNKLKVVLWGYSLFSLIALFILPEITKTYGFELMAASIIICWIIFIYAVLYNTKRILFK